jgi:hypothetical protein
MGSVRIYNLLRVQYTGTMLSATETRDDFRTSVACISVNQCPTQNRQTGNFKHGSRTGIAISHAVQYPQYE